MRIKREVDHAILERDICDYVYECRPLYFDNDETEWAYVRGTDFIYVSDNGRVIDFGGEYPKEIIRYNMVFGYYFVSIVMFGKRKRVYVHRLVAKYFVPNPNNYPLVRHLDDDPTNNCWWNLEWGTPADNRKDCVEHDRDFKKAVYCYELDTVFRSCAEAADKLGVSRSNITLCCKGRNHSVQNKYHLCYLDDKDNKMNNLSEWLYGHMSCKPVKAINVNTGKYYIFSSRQDAARELEVNNSSISNILAGRFSKTGDWTFKNVTPEDYYIYLQGKEIAV